MNRNALVAVGGAAALVGGVVAKTTLTEQRRVRAERTLRIWRLTARRGFHYARIRVVGTAADEKRKAELEEQFVIRTAQDAAQVLGNMKGAIMKAGQMVSFIADGLPPEAAKALATLQSDVAPMSPKLAASVVFNELGAPPEDLFLEWEEVPVAAASIGQVHRAVLRDGRKVAVKVQYPGVDQAISSDLENAQLLYGMFKQFALPSLDVEAMIDEVRSRMREELDYRIEAKSQQTFFDYYAHHPFIRIPGVVHEFSGQRVLTTEWIDGLKWQEFLDTASVEAKQTAGEVLMRFAQGSVHFHQMFNGDPHPGNYRFHPDGSITFLDFGLVKKWTDEDIEELTPVLDTVLSGDAQGLADLMVKLDALPVDHGLDPVMILDYAQTPYTPFISEEFTYTREWLSAALAKVLDFEHGRYRQLLDVIDLPTSYVILDRLVWGVGALLGRLEAVNKWGGLLDEYRFGSTPVSAMGEAELEWRKKYHPEESVG